MARLAPPPPPRPPSRHCGRPELRIAGTVVAILEPSRRRQAVVGVLGQQPGGMLVLLPADPRMPLALVKASTLPPALRPALLVGFPCFVWKLGVGIGCCEL